MPRAVGVFRHAGFDVVPYLVFATEYPHHRHDMRLALWERMGLLVYHARGGTEVLWPSPSEAGEETLGRLDARS